MGSGEVAKELEREENYWNFEIYNIQLLKVNILFFLLDYF